MKKYAYKFSTLVKILMFLAVILALCGIAVDIIWIIQDGFYSPYVGMRYILLFIIATLIIVIIVSMWKFSGYKITKTELICSFGILVSKFSLADMTRITVNKQKKQLTLTFKDESFTNIWVKNEWFEDFLHEILSVNDEIELEFLEEIPKDDPKNDNDKNDKNKPA